MNEQKSGVYILIVINLFILCLYGSCLVGRRSRCFSPRFQFGMLCFGVMRDEDWGRSEDQWQSAGGRYLYTY